MHFIFISCREIKNPKSQKELAINSNSPFERHWKIEGFQWHTSPTELPRYEETKVSLFTAKRRLTTL
jgi:hypothetical protein